MKEQKQGMILTSAQRNYIAVKAVDCEGLEAIEIIKLKINGAVVRE